MVLSVLHEQDGGWHTFTSEQIPGLFVTGPEIDMPSLLDALPSTIHALIVAGGGVDYVIRRITSSEVLRKATDNIETLHFYAAKSGEEAVVSVQW